MKVLWFTNELMTLTLIALYLTNSADIKGSYPFTSPFKVFAFTIKYGWTPLIGQKIWHRPVKNGRKTSFMPKSLILSNVPITDPMVFALCAMFLCLGLPRTTDRHGGLHPPSWSSRLPRGVRTKTLPCHLFTGDFFFFNKNKSNPL